MLMAQNLHYASLLQSSLAQSNLLKLPGRASCAARGTSQAQYVLAVDLRPSVDPMKLMLQS
jgi:hypothetical protein